MRSERWRFLRLLCWNVVWLAVSCVHRRATAPTAELREADLCLGRAHHDVRPGETLYRIASMNHVSTETLARDNRIDDPKQLKVGQRLCLPRSESIPEATAAPKAPSAVPGQPPPSAESHAALIRDAPNFHWPLRGVLYARFGKRGGEVHEGIDLAAPSGTVVHTVAPGRVLFAGEQRGYGQVVIVEHTPGWVSLYAHNETLTVREGQPLSTDTPVATVGESGHTSGPHLHFELRHQGVPVDPLTYLGAPPPPGSK